MALVLSISEEQSLRKEGGILTSPWQILAVAVMILSSHSQGFFLTIEGHCEQDKLRRRQVFDTLLNDFMVSFGKWEFDPLDLSNPFPRNDSFVHIWQGYEDKVVPFQLQRYVSGKLPWIRYHEITDGGHLIVHYKGVCEAILWALLNGEHLPEKMMAAITLH